MPGGRRAPGRKGDTFAADGAGRLAAITFDLWHTLVYLPRAAEEAYYRTQVALAVDALHAATPAAGAPARSDRELAGDFEAALGEAVRAAGEGRTVTPRTQIQCAAAVSGRTVDADRYLARLAQAVRAQPFRLAPGAGELLGSLREDGYTTAVISNTIGETGRSLRPVLRSLGLETAVDRLVFSDEQPWAKPAPEIFWSTLRRLGEQPAQCVHVGDGWADIEGARRAGLRAAILFTGLQDYGRHYRALHAGPGPRAAPATPRVGKLGEVAPLVARLLPPRTRGGGRADGAAHRRAYPARPRRNSGVRPRATR